ncbi:MAG TPA: lantibiotic immunity ABC transporter MutE/EpiE family permease subunit [Epulopiscium sp.]|nr:lantibiotic immunity ABC transporter MutE/EpiE family permease subunit [Candidatus Epulonipiscium sp.]
MINIIKSEFQKAKRTSINKFIIMTPLFAIALSFLWGGGENGAYNWWYVIFLPGMLAIISAQVITREKRISYKGVLLYPRDKGCMWLGKITYISILLAISSLIFMIGIIGVGFVSESDISFKANILATIVLILTLLFQIPISLYLAVQFNMYVTILFNVVFTTLGVVSFGTSCFLVFYPYGITSALMVPILHIFPNGLPVPPDSPLLNGSILGGITINVFIFIFFTFLTSIWFRNKEIN